jgi:erythromycin esterase-like protein
MGRAGEWNVGQLIRERYGRRALLVGFTTYDGTVSAASDWGGPVEQKRVRPAREESYEALFHESGREAFWIDLADWKAVAGLAQPRLERAIGVIYRPDTELASHYFQANLCEQFDAVIHIDHTRSVEPLERTTFWEKGEVEVPETYPTGL